MLEVYVSIGSNIEPELHFCACLAALHARFGQLQCSTIYRTPAVGFDGECFLNAVVSFHTELSSLALQAWLKQLETQQGRERSHQKFSARSLDLDLLLYADSIEPAQKLPHPDILHYNFVLQPLAELAPEQKHPILGESFADLAIKQLHTRKQVPLSPIELSCAQGWQTNGQSEL
ncbi:2-amino-4-hydroxy-6-hydroxymethyldihydropteridinediphosphokinase [Thiothrix eikelboomii]|uniref:2-amino-4-hydroxy-6-hydroxymethyldihydropteridine diphosphokinase n=1 Tax=Thiothrix eikelboomii TaxID=92487 RepID=A0A1T4VRQ4_9GAMM|nr:2-amino-4-hydroxy-6-hydroxymethyldihydropteridine diphosphokinase [Thiothrix eikelboomii]SKA67646.1 2-amino-4-hydroxy-6-hydroxymethyldihydropteridinediphosphokinase [Thiothrix eikelboomii]